MNCKDGVSVRAYSVGWLLLLSSRQYNIKGADSIIKKAISVVGNYKDYAETAGVSPYWTHMIKEEIGYRIDNM